MNQLLSQIQELQDKVNSLSEEKEFDDPETASVSRISQVPNQPLSIPSPRGMLSRDSGMPLMYGVPRVLQETFLKANLLEKDHPQLSSRIYGIWHHLLAD